MLSSSREATTQNKTDTNMAAWLSGSLKASFNRSSKESTEAYHKDQVTYDEMFAKDESEFHHARQIYDDECRSS